MFKTEIEELEMSFSSVPDICIADLGILLKLLTDPILSKTRILSKSMTLLVLDLQPWGNY